MTYSNASKRARGRPVWGFVIAGIILILIVVALLWFLTPFGKPIPKIVIIQPAQHLVVQSGDKVNLIAWSVSINGFAQYQFLVNDLVFGTQSAVDPSAREDEVAFIWSTSQPGIHKLGVVVVNSTGQSSEPAEVLVAVHPRWTTGVNSIPNADDEEAWVERESSDSENTGSSSENENTEEADLQQALGDAEMDDDFPIPINEDFADNIPIINRFEVTNSLNGNVAEVAVSISASDDSGLVTLFFDVANLDDPLHPVTREQACGGSLTCEWDGHLTLEEGGWLLAVQALDVSGLVSERHVRQAHILAGGDPPAIAEGEEDIMISLDPNLSREDILPMQETLDDIGDPVMAEYGCSGQIVYLDVPYTYLSDHGSDVYLGATAESGNIVVAAGHAMIQPGAGVARIEMEVISTDLVDQTDSLELYLRTGGDYFYEEVAALEIFWPIPEPDLTITYLDQAEAILRVEIKNMGCAAFDGFDLQFNLADGQVILEHVDQYLAQGISYTWETFINPEIFGQGFEAIVDPHNLIEEINEENNVDSLLPITVSHVEFYKIVIHDISEGYGRGTKGEFIFFVDLYDDDFFSYRFPPYWESYYGLNGGEHTLFHATDQGLVTGLYVYPYLSWNQDLRVRFSATEDDDYGSDDLGDLVMIFPADFYNEESWKRGGEFFGTSDKGYYTIYFRIVLNPR